jgi:hypothetical protein
MSGISQILLSILLAIEAIIRDFFGFSASNQEGFMVSKLRDLRSSEGTPTPLSFYPVKGQISQTGGDDRWQMFEPYLRQTEHSSREQRDNHRWPTSRTLAGSMEQALSSGPVLPCSYPDPMMRTKLGHTKIAF